MEIEDIQQLRWKQGIEDLELHAEISGLQVGDSVNLTFRADKESFAGETLLGPDHQYQRLRLPW